MFQYYHHVVVVLGSGVPVRHNLGTKPSGSGGDRDILWESHYYWLWTLHMGVVCRSALTVYHRHTVLMSHLLCGMACQKIRKMVLLCK